MSNKGFLFIVVLCASLVLPAISADAALIAHWKLDETSGVIADDASANEYDATLVGGTWSTGTIGGALTLNGTTEGVIAPVTFLDAMRGDFTVAAWIKVDEGRPGSALQTIYGITQAYQRQPRGTA